MSETDAEGFKDTEPLESECIRNGSPSLTFEWQRCNTFKTTFFGYFGLHAKSDASSPNDLVPLFGDVEENLENFPESLMIHLTNCNHSYCPVSDDAEKEGRSVRCYEGTLESLTESLNVTNVIGVLKYLRVLNYSDIYVFADSLSFSDIPSSSDSLSLSDDISCSATEIALEGLDSVNTLNCQPSGRHRQNDTFSVDLSSMLGQRYLRYHGNCSSFQNGEPLLYESYCRWPVSDEFHWLRPRHDPYPITFKKELTSEKYQHLYKFSRAEQIEFAHKVGHQLSRRSRRLLRQMKPCALRVARLSVRTLRKYLSSTYPVVCLTPLSASVLKKLTKKKRVVHFTQKPMQKRKPVRRTNANSNVHCSSPKQRFGLLKDHFKLAKPEKNAEREKAARYPLSCHNRSGEIESRRVSVVNAALSFAANASHHCNSSNLPHQKLFYSENILIKDVCCSLTQTHLPQSRSLLRKRRGVTSEGLTMRDCSVILRDFNHHSRTSGVSKLRTTTGKRCISLPNRNQRIFHSTRKISPARDCFIQFDSKENRSLVMAEKFSGSRQETKRKSNGFLQPLRKVNERVPISCHR